MDESRRQFEEWIEMNFPWRDDRFRLFRGEYMSTWTQNMYRAWQASRQAIELNVPSACKDDSYFFEGTFQPLRYERDVERALSAAGLRIKGEP